MKNKLLLTVFCMNLILAQSSSASAVVTDDLFNDDLLDKIKANLSDSLISLECGNEGRLGKALEARNPDFPGMKNTVTRTHVFDLFASGCRYNVEYIAKTIRPNRIDSDFVPLQDLSGLRLDAEFPHGFIVSDNQAKTFFRRLLKDIEGEPLNRLVMDGSMTGTISNGKGTLEQTFKLRGFESERISFNVRLFAYEHPDQEMSAGVFKLKVNSEWEYN